MPDTSWHSCVSWLGLVNLKNISNCPAPACDTVYLDEKLQRARFEAKYSIVDLTARDAHKVKLVYIWWYCDERRRGHCSIGYLINVAGLKAAARHRIKSLHACKS